LARSKERNLTPPSGRDGSLSAADHGRTNAKVKEPMATQRQIEANQRNAQASTGPRTSAGREASSRNALRHGIRAEKYLIAGEEAEFQQLLDALNEHWKPATALEEHQIFKIATYLMRLDRGARGEAEVIADTPLDSFFRGEQSALRNLLHYETVNRKGLRFEVELLERLQAQRLTRANESVGKCTAPGEAISRKQNGDREPSAPSLSPNER
jgi:hypothetical protein